MSVALIMTRTLIFDHGDGISKPIDQKKIGDLTVNRMIGCIRDLFAILACHNLKECAKGNLCKQAMSGPPCGDKRTKSAIHGKFRLIHQSLFAPSNLGCKIGT